MTGLTFRSNNVLSVSSAFAHIEFSDTITRMGRIQAIEESDYGLYVWLDQNGKILADEEFRMLSVPSKKGDLSKIAALQRVAHEVMKDYGLEPGGGPHFMSGRRQITDEEFEHQRMRQDMGLIPDPYDDAALKEEAKYAKKNG